LIENGLLAVGDAMGGQNLPRGEDPPADFNHAENEMPGAKARH
jgi:hypothetical protein